MLPLRPTLTVLLLAAVALPATALLGCGDRARAPYRVSQDPYGRGQIQIADGHLSQVLRFSEDSPRVSYDDADLMHVAVDVRNTYGRPYIIQYRTRFFDRTGQELYATAWRTQTLESNVQQTLTSVSTTPRADNFQMHIREAN